MIVGTRSGEDFSVRRAPFTDVTSREIEPPEVDIASDDGRDAVLAAEDINDSGSSEYVDIASRDFVREKRGNPPIGHASNHEAVSPSRSMDACTVNDKYKHYTT